MSKHALRWFLPGALVALGYASIVWLTGAGLVDDAYVFLRYAGNIAHANGAVFNPGERVEGYTSPLWLAMQVPLFAFSADPAPIVLAAAAAWGVLCGLALWRLPAESAADRFIRGAFILTNPALVFWSWSGLETPLFAFLLLIAFTLLVPFPGPRRRTLAGAAALGVAALTRPEALWMLPLTMVAAARRGRIENRSSTVEVVSTALPVIVIAGLHAMWRHHYYGAWLPNTYFAKAGLPERILLGKGMSYVAISLIALSPIVAGLAIRCRRSPSADTRAAAGTAAWWSILVMLIGGDHFPYLRFIVPILPIVALGLMPRPEGRRASFPRAWKLAALACVTTNAILLGSPDRRAAVWEVRQARAWAATGRWLLEHRSPDTRMASLVIGAMPYYSRLPTLDLLGLTDASISRAGHVYADALPGHQRYDSSYVLGRDPDLIVLPTSGLYRTTTIEPWPVVPPALFDRFFALHDLLTRPETRARYAATAVQMDDGTYVELLERRRDR